MAIMGDPSLKLNYYGAPIAVENKTQMLRIIRDVQNKSAGFESMIYYYLGEAIEKENGIWNLTVDNKPIIPQSETGFQSESLIYFDGYSWQTINNTHLDDLNQTTLTEAKNLFNMPKQSWAKVSGKILKGIVKKDDQNNIVEDNTYIYPDNLQDDTSYIITRRYTTYNLNENTYASTWEIKTLFGVIRWRGATWNDTNNTYAHKIRWYDNSSNTKIMIEQNKNAKVDPLPLFINYVDANKLKAYCLAQELPKKVEEENKTEESELINYILVTSDLQNEFQYYDIFDALPFYSYIYINGLEKILLGFGLKKQNIFQIDTSKGLVEQKQQFIDQLTNDFLFKDLSQEDLMSTKGWRIFKKAFNYDGTDKKSAIYDFQRISSNTHFEIIDYVINETHSFKINWISENLNKYKNNIAYEQYSDFTEELNLKNEQYAGWHVSTNSQQHIDTSNQYCRHSRLLRVRPDTDYFLGSHATTQAFLGWFYDIDKNTIDYFGDHNAKYLKLNSRATIIYPSYKYIIDDKDQSENNLNFLYKKAIQKIKTIVEEEQANNSETENIENLNNKELYSFFNNGNYTKNEQEGTTFPIYQILKDNITPGQCFRFIQSLDNYVIKFSTNEENKVNYLLTLIEDEDTNISKYLYIYFIGCIYSLFAENLRIVKLQNIDLTDENLLDYYTDYQNKNSEEKLQILEILITQLKQIKYEFYLPTQGANDFSKPYNYSHLSNFSDENYQLYYKIHTPGNCAYIELNLNINTAFYEYLSLSSEMNNVMTNSGDLIIPTGNPAITKYKNKKMLMLGPSTIMIMGLQRQQHQSNLLHQLGVSDNYPDTYTGLSPIIGFHEYLKPFYQEIKCLGFSGDPTFQNKTYSNISLVSRILGENEINNIYILEKPYGSWHNDNFQIFREAIDIYDELNEIILSLVCEKENNKWTHYINIKDVTKFDNISETQYKILEQDNSFGISNINLTKNDLNYSFKINDIEYILTLNFSNIGEKLKPIKSEKIILKNTTQGYEILSTENINSTKKNKPTVKISVTGEQQNIEAIDCKDYDHFLITTNSNQLTAATVGTVKLPLTNEERFNTDFAKKFDITTYAGALQAIIEKIYNDNKITETFYKPIKIFLLTNTLTSLYGSTSYNIRWQIQQITQQIAEYYNCKILIRDVGWNFFTSSSTFSYDGGTHANNAGNRESGLRYREQIIGI